MELTFRILALVTYIVMGIYFTRRWVTHPHIKIQRYSKSLRFAVLFLVCWIGILIVGILQTELSIFYFEPDDLPEDRGIPAVVAYDSVGTNTLCIFFGWMTGPLFVIVSSLLGESSSKSKTTSLDIAP